MIRWHDAVSVARRVALLVLGALGWEAAARSGAFSPLVVPSIARIGRELWWLVVRPESLADAWFSLQRAIVGFTLAAAAGVALGVLIFLECLYPIVVTTQAGSRAVNRVLLWSAANMGASRARILWRVVVPAAAPFIFAGFRIALPIAMIVVIITEMISSADGLGYLAMYSLASLKTDRMLAVVVMIALIGVALDWVVTLLRDRLVFWEKLDSYYVE